MKGRFSSVKESVERTQLLRQEIDELIREDRQCRRGGQVHWSERPKHEARLARMNEIKRELTLLQVGKRTK
jgi:hypothetical protein